MFINKQSIANHFMQKRNTCTRANCQKKNERILNKTHCVLCCRKAVHPSQNVKTFLNVKNFHDFQIKSCENEKQTVCDRIYTSCTCFSQVN